jgi:hypothetical protein
MSLDEVDVGDYAEEDDKLEEKFKQKVRAARAFCRKDSDNDA